MEEYFIPKYPEEFSDYSLINGGVVAKNPQQLNPYQLGVTLFKSIEDRWNKGKFGYEYESCTNREEIANWDKNLGLGRDKIFEIRRTHNDVSFLTEFLTPEFAEKAGLYTIRTNYQGYKIIDSKEAEEVRKALIPQFVNAGQPVIRVVDGNHGNRGELYLMHDYDGRELEYSEARETLRNLHKLWGRPVCIETEADTNAGHHRIMMRFDGQQNKTYLWKNGEFEEVDAKFS